MHSFPDTLSTFLFNGPIGKLEVMTNKPAEGPISGTAIICHPHPLFGGTMHNKVVTTLERVCRERGLRTVCFNFRGVGLSEGVHDEGMGEMDDLLALADWVTTLYPHESLWFAGFSFGAYVSTRAALTRPINQLISIAPQASRFKEMRFPSIDFPWIVVQGEQDEVVSPQEVFKWVETLHPEPVLIKIPEAGHFFHGKLLELRKLLHQALIVK